jgi:Zn finger protein HypA/HybF involved in hydrogenase expression
MTQVAEDSGKSSTLTDLTLQVRQPGTAEQEVFLQHGLSLGRNASNSLCIDNPEVERIHAQVLRQADGGMLLECASSTARVLLPDGTKVNQLALKPGTTFKIGPATIRCLKRETKTSVVVTDNPWQVRCPRCHEVLANLSHKANKCPGCKGELLYFKQEVPAGSTGFEGWLPKQIGPYSIRAFVAQGGMGLVLRGLHKDNDMPAAVKLLRGDADHDPSWKTRFEAEIGTLTSLKHPNVVRLQAHGRDEKLLWLAMDWIDGTPMTSWVAKMRGGQAPFPLEQLRSALSQIVSGLKYLHGQRIIHRDLKPGNILIAQDDLVKMVDFGIARSSTGDTMAATRLTQTGMVTGTESYMAPEQAEGREVTTASDVFAFGVIWYELLTGRRPMGAFVSPELVRRDTPIAWSQAIARCLAGDPRMRPSLDELARVLGGLPAAPPPIPGAQVAMGTGPVPMAPGSTPGTPWQQPVVQQPTGPVPQAGWQQNVAVQPTGYQQNTVQKPQRTGPSAGQVLSTKFGAAGALAAGAGRGLAAFFRAHPPSQWIAKLGPLGVMMRKSPKVWIAGGAVGLLLIVILFIHHLSDTPAAKKDNGGATPAAANGGQANPLEAAQPTPEQQQQLAQQQAAQQLLQQQDPALEQQSYQRATLQVCYENSWIPAMVQGSFPQYGTNGISVQPKATPDAGDLRTYVVDAIYYYIDGYNRNTQHYTCTVHLRQENGQPTLTPDRTVRD